MRAAAVIRTTLATMSATGGQFIYFCNSWSNAWGRNGDGYFYRNYLPNVIEIGIAITLPAPYIFTADMRQGMQNNDVLQLQRRLSVKPETGFYGPLTTQAVTSDQKAHGIDAAGFCGPITRKQLNTSLA
jgi:peptidoglycan hydrolase-like protein with peptidoglycan-binding domain